MLSKKRISLFITFSYSLRFELLYEIVFVPQEELLIFRTLK